jgi:hypothetical protein
MHQLPEKIENVDYKQHKTIMARQLNPEKQQKSDESMHSLNIEK